MGKPDTIVAIVIASNRPENLCQWLDAWQPYNDEYKIVVVEDALDNTPEILNRVSDALSWNRIEKLHGNSAWIFSKKDSCIKVAGFLKALELGADVIITLDDDCLPQTTPQQFVRQHLDNLEGKTVSRWTSSIPGLRVRGLPYQTNNQPLLGSVKISLGLWALTPDLDAPTSLGLIAEGGIEADLLTQYQPPDNHWVVPHGQLIPISGMNLAFTSDIAYAMYWPLQGEVSPYRRYDDIWGCLFAQKVLEVIRGKIVVGPPHINHVRASDPYVNLIKEAPGLQVNETLWQVFDQIKVEGDNVKEVVLKIASHMSFIDKPYSKYLNQWSNALTIWTNLVDKALNHRDRKGISLGTVTHFDDLNGNLVRKVNKEQN